MSHPISDAALDDRLGFVGTAGSGKTYNALAAVERILDMGGRVVLVDPLDVHWGLRLRPDGKAPSGYAVPIFGGAHGDLPLNEHAGALIGETVAGMAESCIVSLGGLPTKSAERRFMLSFLETLYRKTDRGEPFHLVFDEADLWAPQKSSEPMLQNLMEQIVRRGRVKGFIPWLITQRPAVISKDVLSQVDGLVVFKLTSSQDRDALEGWIEGQADRQQWKEIRAALPTLAPGHGVVWVPNRGVLSMGSFPQRKTFDSSRTPKRGEKKRGAEVQPLDLSVLKERLASVEVEAKANDPKALKAEVAALKRQLAQRAPAPVAAAPDPEALAKAEAAGHSRGWAEGHAKAVADVMPAFRTLREHADEIVAHLKAEEGNLEKLARTATAPATQPRAAVVTVAPSVVRAMPPASPANSDVGQGGLRRILVALAQCPAGLTNRQIGVRAGLSSKSGTFSTYISRARSNGWIEGQGRVLITQAGLDALGNYEPMPTGEALLNHWLRELGDSGAARLLRVIADAYPKALSNSQAGERANLSHQSGTFSTYLSRLRSLELIEGRGELRASEELFG